MYDNSIRLMGFIEKDAATHKDQQRKGLRSPVRGGSRLVDGRERPVHLQDQAFLNNSLETRQTYAMLSIDLGLRVNEFLALCKQRIPFSPAPGALRLGGDQSFQGPLKNHYRNRDVPLTVRAGQILEKISKDCTPKAASSPSHLRERQISAGSVGPGPRTWSGFSGGSGGSWMGGKEGAAGEQGKVVI
jgi:hypothetical protein